MSGGKGGGSSGTNHSTDTTNWSNAWAPGTNAAIAGLSNAETQLGSYFSPQQYDLANQADSLATNPTQLNESNEGFTSLLDPNSMVNTNLAGIAAGNNTNPQLDAMFQQGAGQVENSLAGEFNSAGRTGSGAQEFNTSQGLNNLATDIYGGAYDNNQNRAITANQDIAGNTAAGSAGLTGNFGSLVGATGEAEGLESSVSPYAQLSDYNSLVAPFLNLNNTDQNNSSVGYDDTGSFKNDLGYIGDVASLVGSFA